MSLLWKVHHITATCHPHQREPSYCSHKVTPQEDGPTQPLKTTQAMRGPEEELQKSREELRVIHEMMSTVTRSKEQKL